ncbi:hypothetical protein [Micromonospora yangpuensis]|nr:hypothetical protein [Micromonospora yangpuensis]
MATDEMVIDLDERDNRPVETTQQAASRRRGNGRLVAASAVGALVGGLLVAAGHFVYDQQQQAGTVTFAAMPEAIQESALEPGIATVETSFAVVNAGPEPITVRAATATRPGIELRTFDGPVTVEPNRSQSLPIRLTFRCAELGDPVPLAVSFSVGSADGQVHAVERTIPLADEVWYLFAQNLCRYG